MTVGFTHMPATKRPARMRVRMSEIRASYDAAQTTPENQKHWGAADHLSANAAHDPVVRAFLRARARYEYANNSYCRGMLLTLANDVIGTGPRLQILNINTFTATWFERVFRQWAREIRLGEKLRAARLAKARDGEVFVMRVTNPRLRHAVKLDLRLIEADQVTTPDLQVYRGEQLTDGIVHDRLGNPNFYHVLKHHPGETGFMGGFFVRGLAAYDTVAAANVRHWFRLERPGQTRGVPEITPALPLYAQLRRYTLAVIAAAETAADVAMIIKSTYQPDPNDDSYEAPSPMDLIELERRMAMVMPEGWEGQQFKAEQPTTTYKEFKAEIVNEIARCLNMPFNVAAGNSSGYNYSSGKLDHQVYWRSNDIDRDDCELVVLDWALESFLQEASRVPGLLPFPATISGESAIDHAWHWDGVGHVDPAKEANAQQTRLGSLTTSLAREYAREGHDWETELRQIARERRLMQQLGIEPKAPAPTPAAKENDDEREEAEETETEEARA
jgi:lambda family phage portal protein